MSNSKFWSAVIGAAFSALLLAVVCLIACWWFSHRRQDLKQRTHRYWVRLTDERRNWFDRREVLPGDCKNGKITLFFGTSAVHFNCVPIGSENVNGPTAR